MAFSDHCKKYPGFVISNKEFANHLQNIWYQNNSFIGLLSYFLMKSFAQKYRYIKDLIGYNQKTNLVPMIPKIHTDKKAV